MGVLSVLTLQWSLVPPQVRSDGSIVFGGPDGSSLRGKQHPADIVEVVLEVSQQLRGIDDRELGQDERYFSACLVTMDDNFFWPGTRILLRFDDPICLWNCLIISIASVSAYL